MTANTRRILGHKIETTTENAIKGEMYERKKCRRLVSIQFSVYFFSFAWPFSFGIGGCCACNCNSRLLLQYFFLSVFVVSFDRIVCCRTRLNQTSIYPVTEESVFLCVAIVDRLHFNTRLDRNYSV